MEDNKELKAEAAKEETELTPEERKQRAEKFKEEMKARMEEAREKTRIANEAIGQGKGRLALETPIIAGDEEITELVYDFTTLTGWEYADAMDKDPNAQQLYRITNRQALALFAAAAAKETDRLDARDIMERIGATDGAEGVHLATLFFIASMRAGRLRITKK